MTGSRLIAHILAPSPIIPLLTEVRLSSSLVHLKAHPPAVLAHLSTAYLTLPPPHSTPEKFWSVFTPLTERYHDCEKLVFGSDGEGSGGSEIVVEIIVRSAGGNGRRRGVERVLEAWSSTGPCELQDLDTLKGLWSRKAVLQNVRFLCWYAECSLSDAYRTHPIQRKTSHSTSI